jgi:uncharacterized protein
MEAAALIERMRPTFAAQPSVAAAWLFGSAARGSMRIDSDVDVGVVFVAGMSSTEREQVLLDLASRLEAATAPHPVEVVALEDQGWVFIHRALSDGKRIVVHDDERRSEFEATAHVRYLDWKPTWDLAANEQQAGLRRWLAARRRRA